jgi:hypothetical protein
MRKIVTILLVILLSSCTETKTQELPDDKNVIEVSPTNPYDFDENKIGLDNAADVASGVIYFLKNADTTRYLSLAISLEAQKYLFEKNFEFRPDIKDTSAYMDSLEIRFDKRMQNFLVRSSYIHEIMIEDKKFDIKMAKIDTIIVESKRIKDYGGFDRPIIGNWAEVTIIMDFNEEKFHFEIPQIIELKGKWFLYYPEYYIRDKKEKAFINEYLKEKNEKADEFLK